MHSPQTDLPRWVFLPQREGEINSDPFSDEFFAGKSLAASLVRESIQNSLDARFGPDPVRVRFTFGTASERLSPAQADRWLAGLWPHLKGRNAGLKDAPDETEPLGSLLVEDFGTRGLRGDPHRTRDDAAGEGPNDFFYFWRNLGRSGKKESDRGRWGLGKSVFPASGRLHTIFGLTRRANDGRTLLYGQSVLGTHSTDQGHWTSFGFFGHVRDAGLADELALPVEDPEILADFARDFGLSRRDESGFSVVILHPPAELRAEEVFQHSILHFFYPILAGDLVVEVVNEGFTTTISQATIREHARALRFDGRARHKGESLAALMDMAAAVQTFPVTDLIPVARARLTDKPRWKESPLPEASLDGLQQRFEAGGLVGFRVPVRIRRVGSEIEPTYFDAFLQRDDNLKRGEFHFIRQGITITDVTNPPRHKVRAMLVANDRTICQFLGDAENPAHTQWEERNKHFQNRYDNGVLLLRFVITSLGELTEYLLQAREGMDADLLSHLFYVEAEETAADPVPVARVGSRDERGEKPFSPFAVQVHTSHEPFLLERLEGGFVVRANTAVGRPPGSLRIEVAYEVRRGDPFNKYSPLDFDLSANSLRVTVEGAKLREHGPNWLEIAVFADTFTVRVQGFDPRRDVRVRAFEPVES